MARVAVSFLALVFCSGALAACARAPVQPASPPGPPSILRGYSLAIAQDSSALPSAGLARRAAVQLPLAPLLNRSASPTDRANAFALFHEDGFARVASIVRRADLKNADILVRALCTYSYVENARTPQASNTQAEWHALRLGHRAAGEEGKTLALLDATEPTPDAAAERAALDDWMKAGSTKPVVLALRRARAGIERAALCPSPAGLRFLDEALREALTAATALRLQHQGMTPDNAVSEDSQAVIGTFTLAPLAMIASKLLQGDVRAAQQLAQDGELAPFVNPAILEALRGVSAAPTASEYAVLALTLRIVTERDARNRAPRHRDPASETLVELASARLAREAQVLQPTAPEVTLLASRVLSPLGLGALGIAMLEPVAKYTQEEAWLQEVLNVTIAAEGEAAGRGDRIDVDRIFRAAAPVLAAAISHAPATLGVEVWRATAIAAEAALRDGDGAGAEVLFRAIAPSPPEIAVSIARLEAGSGNAVGALARLDALAAGAAPPSGPDVAVHACEIAAFAGLPEAPKRCENALNSILGASALWSREGTDDGKSDRLLARVLMRFRGGLDGALRALDRAYYAARKSGGDVSFIVGQAVGAAVTSDAPHAAQAVEPWVARAMELDADDFVYFGLWAETLFRRHGHAHEHLDAALHRARPQSPWVQALLAARVPNNLPGLEFLARQDTETAEAVFYTGLSAWGDRRDAEALEKFRRCRSYRALELMENGFSEAFLRGPSQLVLPPHIAIP